MPAESAPARAASARSRQVRLTDAQCERIYARVRELDKTRAQFLADFRAAGNFTKETGRARLWRVCGKAPRDPLTEESRLLIARALGWRLGQFEREVLEWEDEPPASAPANGAGKHERGGGAATRGLGNTPAVRQSAYAALVQVESHQIARGVDWETDSVRKVHEAAHRLFLELRRIVAELNVAELAASPAAQSVKTLLDEVMHSGLRPHLTRWAEDYSAWHERAMKTAAGRRARAADLQRKFPRWKELQADLTRATRTLRGQIERLKALIFEA